MKKVKRFLAQFLVFAFWSAVMTTCVLIVAYSTRHNSFPPAWRWWDVLGLSMVSAAIIMTGRNIFRFQRLHSNFRFWGSVAIFYFWFLGLVLPEASLRIFNQKLGPFLLFSIPSGLGVILIMALGHKNIWDSANRALGWAVVSIWAILLIFVFSLTVAKGFNFVFPHLDGIVPYAMTAAVTALVIIILMMIFIFTVKGLVALHRAAFKKEVD